MKYCTLCHWLLQGRRWLLFIPTMLFTLLTPLFAPVWLFLLLLSVHLLLAALCAIYLRDLHDAVTPDHLRMPAPRDGQAEIVMVDAALVDYGPALLGAAQPAAPSPELSAQMGPGVMQLGRAMCLLGPSLPRADAHALKQAAREQLGLKASELLTQLTVLRHGTESGMKCVTVQEDEEERTYFTGDAETVLKACASIWEGDEHLMGAEDHSRIRAAARELAASGEHLYAFATALGDEEPAFLGLTAVGDAVDPAAIAQLRRLRSMGVTLILRDDGTRHMDVPVLRRNLDIPDLHARPDIHLCITNPYPDQHTLAIIRHSDRTLDEPVLALREHFSAMAFMLGRLWGVMTLCLMCCVLVGGLYSALAVTAVLAAGYLSFGSLISARAVRPMETVLTGIACLLIRLLLNAAAPAAQDLAGTLLCLTAASLLTLTLAVPGRKITLRDLAPMLIVIAAVLVVQLIRSWAVLGAALLPAVFCIVCGLLIGSIFLFTGR